MIVINNLPEIMRINNKIIDIMIIIKHMMINTIKRLIITVFLLNIWDYFSYDEINVFKVDINWMQESLILNSLIKYYLNL